VSVDDKISDDDRESKNKDQDVETIILPLGNQSDEDEGLKSHADKGEDSPAKEVCQRREYDASD
jgi:hypothetical protein